MRKPTRPLSLVIILLVASLLAACPRTSTPTPIVAPTEAVTAQPEPTQAATAMPEPTEEPTAVPEPTEEATAVPEPTETPPGWCQPLSGVQREPSNGAYLPANQYYVDQQVIFTGLQDDFARIAEFVPELELTPLSEPISLGYVEEYLGQLQKGEAQAGFGTVESLPWSSYGGLAIQAFEISSGTDVPTALELLYNTARSEQLVVFADPNYVTGFPITGDPWEIEGSPWEIEGSAAEGGGPGAAQADFWNQWGFVSKDKFGIAPGQTLQPPDRTLDLTGDGITVGVFDTVPEADLFATSGITPVDWIDPTLWLCVTRMAPVTALDVEDATEDVSDHGLFGSGLVYAVAPSSHIHLIEVLNRTGQGDLMTLIQALNAFVMQNLKAGPDLPLSKTVINLSLGTSDPADAKLPPDLADLIRELIDSLPPNYRPLVPGNIPIVSLETLMGTVYGLGGVIVAASGNDSALKGSPGLVPQIPAAYPIPMVVGVAASNQYGTRSCYSNQADPDWPDGMNGLAAPGGDGTTGCKPAVAKCQDYGPDCPYGVISLMRKKTDEGTGYGYWVGTSFSTPMVSGAAALLLEANTPPDGIINSMQVWQSPAPPGLGKGVLKIAP